MPNPSQKQSQASGKFYAANCDCGFTAKSHNQGEMEEIVGLHGKRSHPDMKMSSSDIRQMVKAV